jgi:integrase/recombinase XerC
MASNLQKFQEYLEKEKKYAQHTVNAYVKDVVVFKDFIADQFDGLILEQVEYNAVRSWIVSQIEGGKTNGTVNRRISSLKAFYKFLLKIKQIEVNPLVKHKSLKIARKIQIPFSENEVENVLGKLEVGFDFESVRNRLIVELFYVTGMRRSELINLELKNIDFENRFLKVLGKRNKERIVPLLECTIGLLKVYLEFRSVVLEGEQTEVLILSKKGNKISESFVYRLINDYFSNVSQKVKKSPHVLRHSFATHLLNNGADLNSVKELLGHASLSSTQIYTHSSLAELKKVYQNAHPRNQQ